MRLDLADGLGLVFRHLYRDGILRRSILTDNGRGTLTRRQVEAKVKVQVDTVTQAQLADGYAEDDVQVIVLLEGLGALFPDEPTVKDDDEIEIPELNVVYRLSGTIRDPVNSNCSARGRLRPKAPSIQQTPSFTPLAVSDFRNGIYSIGGVSKTLADLWKQDLSWAAWNPASIIPGVGIQLVDNPVGFSTLVGGPVSTPELFAAMIAPEKAVCVIDYTMLQSGPGVYPLVSIGMQDLPGYNAGYFWVDDHRFDQITIADEFETVSVSDSPTSFGVKRAAFSFMPYGLSFSVNGGKMFITGAPADASTNNSFALFLSIYGSGVNTGTVIIHSISFYPADAADHLPVLSA